VGFREEAEAKALDWLRQIGLAVFLDRYLHNR
jgi:hypothetical protein